MASQMVGITGNRRLRRNQTAELNSRLSFLPQILYAEQKKKQNKAEMDYKNRALAQDQNQYKATLAQQRDEQSRAQGLSAAKFGATVLASDFDLNKFIPFGGGTKRGSYASVVSPGTTSPGRGGSPSETRFLNKTTSQIGGQSSGLFSNINVGGALKSGFGGGLMGYGIAGVLGGKKKQKMLGGALGALGGALYGSGALQSALGSAGEMFSGLFK